MNHSPHLVKLRSRLGVSIKVCSFTFVYKSSTKRETRQTIHQIAAHRDWPPPPHMFHLALDLKTPPHQDLLSVSVLNRSQDTARNRAVVQRAVEKRSRRTPIKGCKWTQHLSLRDQKPFATRIQRRALALQKPAKHRRPAGPKHRPIHLHCPVELTQARQLLDPSPRLPSQIESPGPLHESKLAIERLARICGIQHHRQTPSRFERLHQPLEQQSANSLPLTLSRHRHRTDVGHLLVLNGTNQPCRLTPIDCNPTSLGRQRQFAIDGSRGIHPGKGLGQNCLRPFAVSRSQFADLNSSHLNSLPE